MNSRSLSKPETIEQYRQESIEADEKYHALIESHGPSDPLTIQAMRDAESAYGSWAEWYYGTE